MDLPLDWCEAPLHTVAASMRFDPHSAHGQAPASLLLGRKIVFPLEMKIQKPTFEGNNCCFFHLCLFSLFSTLKLKFVIFFFNTCFSPTCVKINHENYTLTQWFPPLYYASKNKQKQQMCGVCVGGFK